MPLAAQLYASCPRATAMAYRWFCRLGLDGSVPDHSTFSKNRYGRFQESGRLQGVAWHSNLWHDAEFPLKAGIENRRSREVDVAFDKPFHSPCGHGLRPEAVVAKAAHRLLEPEERHCGVAADAGNDEPGGQPPAIFTVSVINN